MPVPEVVPGADPVPMWQQAVAAFIGIGSLCAMIANAFRRSAEEHKASPVVIGPVGTSETKPFAEALQLITVKIERVAIAAEKTLMLIQERIDLDLERERKLEHARELDEAVEEALKRFGEAKLAEQGRDEKAPNASASRARPVTPPASRA